MWQKCFQNENGVQVGIRQFAGNHRAKHNIRMRDDGFTRKTLKLALNIPRAWQRIALIVLILTYFN